MVLDERRQERLTQHNCILVNSVVLSIFRLQENFKMLHEDPLGICGKHYVVVQQATGKIDRKKCLKHNCILEAENADILKRISCFIYYNVRAKRNKLFCKQTLFMLLQFAGCSQHRTQNLQHLNNLRPTSRLFSDINGKQKSRCPGGQRLSSVMCVSLFRHQFSSVLLLYRVSSFCAAFLLVEDGQSDQVFSALRLYFYRPCPVCTTSEPNQGAETRRHSRNLLRQLCCRYVSLPECRQSWFSSGDEVKRMHL